MAAFSRRAAQLDSMLVASDFPADYILSTLTDWTLVCSVNLMATFTGLITYLQVRNAVNAKNPRAIKRSVHAFSIYELATTWIIYITLYGFVAQDWYNSDEDVSLTDVMYRTVGFLCSVAGTAKTARRILEWLGFCKILSRKFNRDLLRLSVAQICALVGLQLRSGTTWVGDAWRIPCMISLTYVATFSLKAATSKDLWDPDNTIIVAQLRRQASMRGTEDEEAKRLCETLERDLVEFQTTLRAYNLEDQAIRELVHGFAELLQEMWEIRQTNRELLRRHEEPKQKHQLEQYRCELRQHLQKSEELEQKMEEFEQKHRDLLMRAGR